MYELSMALAPRIARPKLYEARLTAEARWRAAPSIPPLCHKKAASRLAVTA